MALSVKHAFTSAKSDGADATLVRPSNWNAEHTLTAAVDKVLGTNSGSTTVTELACTAFGRSQIAAADLAAWLTATALQGSAMTWTGTQTVNASFSTQQAMFIVGRITPTALASDTNDWAPTLFSSCTRVRASSSSHVSVTGLAGGADGRYVFLENVGSFNITLVSESGSSSGANRFTMPRRTVLRPSEVIALIYDSTTSRWRAASPSYAAPVPTMQDLISGSGATYNTPPGATKLRVRAVGGGGGGAGGGGTTTFNSITAVGGSSPGSITGAAGGTGGSGSVSLRLPGEAGETPLGVAGSDESAGHGGEGGNSALFGYGASRSASANALANTGGGGHGRNGTGAGVNGIGGAGGGEYVEFWIDAPATSYSYTVGAGGGSNASCSAGGSGRIIVEEFYD